MDFSGKVVLVTGASRGIGRAIARMFADHGARVALHYHRSHQQAERTLAELAGGPHRLVQADVADPQEARRLVETVIREMGGLDVLVNNAGVHEHHPLPEVSYERWLEVWRETLATNLSGPANLCFCAARHMMTHGGGRIVNISSRGAFRGEPTSPAYGASKAGLNSLSQSLAKALAPHGVFVYAIAPGYVETDMAAEILAGPEGEEIRRQSPLNRVARPEEVAHTALFLASPGSEFLTGGIVDVNGASYLRS